VEKAFREMKGKNVMGPIRYRLWNRVDAYLTVVNHLAYLLRAAARWRLLSAGRRESG
jgi:transposase